MKGKLFDPWSELCYTYYTKPLTKSTFLLQLNASTSKWIILIPLEEAHEIALHMSFGMIMPGANGNNSYPPAVGGSHPETVQMDFKTVVILSIIHAHPWFHALGTKIAIAGASYEQYDQTKQIQEQYCS